MSESPFDAIGGYSDEVATLDSAWQANNAQQAIAESQDAGLRPPQLDYATPAHHGVHPDLVDDEPIRGGHQADLVKLMQAETEAEVARVQAEARPVDALDDVRSLLAEDPMIAQPWHPRYEEFVSGMQAYYATCDPRVAERIAGRDWGTTSASEGIRRLEQAAAEVRRERGIYRGTQWDLTSIHNATGDLGGRR